jgi:hypothetical protein
MRRAVPSSVARLASSLSCRNAKHPTILQAKGAASSPIRRETTAGLLRGAKAVTVLSSRAVLPVALLIVSAAARFATAIVVGVVAALAAGLLRSLLAVCLPAGLW